MLAYLINRYFANQRKLIEKKNFLNSKELLAPFRDIDIATLEDPNTGKTVKKAVLLPPDTERLLQKIKLLHVAETQQK